MSLCDGRDHLISQNMDSLRCARCGKGFGAAARPTGEEPAGFIADALYEAQIDTPDYGACIADRLEAGEREYGPFQFLNDDPDSQAAEETIDVGGWLLLADSKDELLVEAGELDPLIAARRRHLRVKAVAHAIRALSCIRAAQAPHQGTPNVSEAL